MDPSKILLQLQSLNAQRLEAKPAAREQMLIVAQALVASLQTPSEFISNIGWAEPARFASIRTAIDLDIFETLNKAGDEGATSTDLSNVRGADVKLVGRIMKHLAATNVVTELEEDVYTPNHISSQLTEPKFRDGIIYTHDVALPPFVALPTYLSTTSHTSPSNPTSGPFQHAHKTPSHFFPYLASNPTLLSAFANYMSGYRASKTPWFSDSFYPISRLTTNLDKSAPLLVDVGGGKGHDLLALTTSHPDLPGRLVLQDTPETLASISPPLPANIEVLPHDFFTPQPSSISGARAYFLHSVLHDWDDDSCIKILSTLKSALKPGYSKVLIHELIVPATGAEWGVTSMDLLMMVLGSVKERRESEWRSLIKQAGLKIEEIWWFEGGTEAVIEVVL